MKQQKGFSVPVHEVARQGEAVRLALSHERRWSRWKWLGYLRSRRHVKRAAILTSGERVIHAVIVLRSTLEGHPLKGKVILIACVCGACFWREESVVKDEMLQGDWAKPFREQLKVPARGKAPK